MNLDMLFWAAAKLQDNSMYAAALSHAKISQHCHVRADCSTAHVVVFDPGNGAIKSVLTNQGYADDSTGLKTAHFSKHPRLAQITS